MTKIPVIEESEMFFKMKTTDDLIKDAMLLTEQLKIKHSKREHRMKMLLVSLTSIFLTIFIINGYCAFYRMVRFGKVTEQQAQCESIGGRYDGEACWYNGEKVDVDKYVEEWK